MTAATPTRGNICREPSETGEASSPPTEDTDRRRQPAPADRARDRAGRSGLDPPDRIGSAVIGAGDDGEHAEAGPVPTTSAVGSAPATGQPGQAPSQGRDRSEDRRATAARRPRAEARRCTCRQRPNGRRSRSCKGRRREPDTHRQRIPRPHGQGDRRDPTLPAQAGRLVSGRQEPPHADRCRRTRRRGAQPAAHGPTAIAFGTRRSATAKAVLDATRPYTGSSRSRAACSATGRSTPRECARLASASVARGPARAAGRAMQSPVGDAGRAARRERCATWVRASPQVARPEGPSRRRLHRRLATRSTDGRGSAAQRRRRLTWPP